MPIIWWAFVAPTMLADLELHLTWSDGWLVWTIANFYVLAMLVFTTHHFKIFFMVIMAPKKNKIQTFFSVKKQSNMTSKYTTKIGACLYE